MGQITMKYFVTWIVYTHADIAWQSSSSLLCWHPAVFLGLPATLNNCNNTRLAVMEVALHMLTRRPVSLLMHEIQAGLTWTPLICLQQDQSLISQCLFSAVLSSHQLQPSNQRNQSSVQSACPTNRAENDWFGLWVSHGDAISPKAPLLSRRVPLDFYPADRASFLGR